MVPSSPELPIAAAVGGHRGSGYLDDGCEVSSGRSLSSGGEGASLGMETAIRETEEYVDGRVDGLGRVVRTGKPMHIITTPCEVFLRTASITTTSLSDGTTTTETTDSSSGENGRSSGSENQEISQISSTGGMISLLLLLQ